ncbi:MAG: hypothetical protein ACI9U2_000483 [Bradymonadia bacterium]|jgi:hypothetical protein
MRHALLLLLALLVLVGCGPTPPAADPKTDAAVAAPVTAVTAQLPPQPLSRLHGVDPANHMVWIKDFDRQTALAPAEPLTTAARALVPPGEAKIIAYEIEREMVHTQPAPGRHEDMIRIVTTDRGAALRAAVVRHLKRAGYAVIDEQLRSPMAHPTHGSLTVKITEQTDLAARVEFNLMRRATAPLADPTGLLRAPVRWLHDQVYAPVGYEFAHYHAVRFAGAFTDAQRLAYAVRTDDLPALKAALVRAARADGFNLAAKQAQLYRTDDGRVFTTRTTDEPGVLVIHISARWPVKQALKKE